MKVFSALLTAVFMLCLQIRASGEDEFPALRTSLADDHQGFWLEESDDTLEIHCAGRRIATYLKQHHKLTRPAFVNVCLPSGIQITRNFPPRRPEDLDPGYSGENGIIHPVMHPGLWIGYGDVNGNDYWRLKAKVEFDGYVQKPEADSKHASFTVRNRYLTDDGKQTVCLETVRYDWHRIDQGLLIDIRVNYQSEREFYFGDQEESGLGVRVASPIRVQGGNGSIINDRGDKNGAEVWGQEAKWFDYFGNIDGREVGVMVVSDPENPRPSWVHARDYGLVVTNPFPKQPKERREPYVKTPVKAGESFTLGWTVVLHESPPGEDFGREAMYRQILAAFSKERTR